MRIERQIQWRPAALAWRAWPVLLLGACCLGLAVSGADGQSANSVAAPPTAAPASQNSNTPALPSPVAALTAPAAANAAPAELAYYGYQVVNTFPHDPRAFTQGLLFHDGKLLESTGQYNQSSLREVDLATGNVLRKWPVPGQYFAEGLALFDGKLYQLTWKENKAFVYDFTGNPQTFHKVGEFSYTGEGWGLTTDGKRLILSDGSATLRFLNPATFAVDHTIRVIEGDRPLEALNELEYVKGEIYANVWKTDSVARIDPASGRVVGMIDFSFLLPEADRTGTDVLNGIAYDPAGDRLFVTGKNWPKLFEVRLKKK